MRRILILISALGALLPAPGAAQEALFPRPSALEPRVQLWLRVYSEVGTDGGLLHDSVDLGVVYGVVRFPGLTGRAFEREVEEAKDDTASILRRLARGVREGLSPDEERVLRAWPPGVSDHTLAGAAKRVRFQLGQADKFRAGVARAGAWEPYIRGVLEEHGLPPELAAIPHVESSFNPAAHSHVGASGIWQFMRSTGRRFMRVDHVVDERRDPLLSTVAAARLLRENYEATGTWPLAITAYNHGAAGMKRAVQKLGTRDIATIVERYESRSFGFASKNFYAEFLAALQVSGDAERYFGPIERHPPADPEIVVLDAHYDAATLASAFGVSLDVLREYNAALLSPIWQGQKYVPARYGLRLPRSATRPPGAVVLAGLAPGERFAAQKPDRHYRVHRGDTLSRIAHRFGVSERELVALNGLRSKHQISVGQLLRLPSREDAPVAAAVAVRAPQAAVEPPPASGVYRVRAGDSLSGIAKRFGVSERDLLALNKLRNRHHLVSGQLLQVPGGSRSPEPAKPAEDAATTRYTVRPGDTLYGIAARHGVGLSEILALNRLANRNALRPGQTLLLPAQQPPAATAAVEVAETQPLPAEQPPRTAAPVEVAQAQPAPQTAPAARTEPALEVAVLAPPAAAPAPIAADPAPARSGGVVPAAGEPPAAEPALVAPPARPTAAPVERTAPAQPTAPVERATPAPPESLDKPAEAPSAVTARAKPDRAASASARAEAPPRLEAARFAVGADATIRVEPEETLGHYADWLEIATHRLRQLNGLRSDTPLALGRRVRLDFARVPQATFEERRLAFHRSLHADFFRSHRVASTEDYVLERGDTLWILSQRKLSVPVWLLHAYNPDVDFAAPLRVGQRLRVPRLAPRDA
jgi:membrane-bound lytic murein transglycosylase D